MTPRTIRPTRPARTRARRTRAGLALLLALLLPVSTSARPSLVDLDTDLQQVVDGLCHGDAALCGVAVPASVAGQLDFDGAFALDFTSVTFGFDVAGSLTFDSLSATVDASGLSAQLVTDLSTAKLYSKVDVIVPDPSGPGTATILNLQNVILESLSGDSSGGLVTLELVFAIAEMKWMGASSLWNQVGGVGSGCTLSGGEQHVALAGSSASLLAPGEVEAGYALYVASPGGVAFQYDRAPVASSACLLRTAGAHITVGDSFHRLSPLSDTFSAQLRAESIDFSSALIGEYTLVIEAASMRESVRYGTLSGLLTTRTFDPGTGSQTGQVQTAI